MNWLLALLTVGMFAWNALITLPTVWNKLSDNMTHSFGMDYLRIV